MNPLDPAPARQPKHLRPTLAPPLPSEPPRERSSSPPLTSPSPPVLAPPTASSSGDDPMDQFLRASTSPRDRAARFLVGLRSERPGRPSLSARWTWSLVAMGVVAAGFVGWWAMSSQRAPVELSLPRAISGSAATTGAANENGLASGAGTSSTVAVSSSSTTLAPARSVVHVAGAVVRPGIVDVPTGSRVADVVAACGGLSADADVDRINLASVVADGSRVYVLRRGEPDVPPAAAPTLGAPAMGSSTTTGAAGSAVPGPIPLNQATAAELDALPGIGPSTAASIIDYRTQHGAFQAIDELLEVRGIGPAKLEQLRSLLVVP